MTGQEVDAKHHVLRRRRDRTTVGRAKDVVRRQHEDAGFCLRLCRQRQVDGHLVTVEVSVERCTNERVNLNGLTFDELWLERLDAQPVQRRCTVQHHWVLSDDLFKHVPHDGA